MGEHPRTIVIVAAFVLLAGFILAWVFIGREPNDVRSAPLVEVSDPPVIRKSTELTHLSIATSENFARQKIYIISAYLKNAADKPIRMAEVKLRFTDDDGKTVEEYTQKILDRNQKPLPPGMETRFEVRQENLPRSWNYRVPVTEITKIGY